MILLGTYLTKAEKEKAKKIQARLESMKAAGMQIPSADSTTAAAAPVKASDLFKKTNKKNINHKEDDRDFVVETLKDTTTISDSAVVVAEEEVIDDWDAVGSDDDWESNIEKITLNFKPKVNDVEDEIELEKKKEHEKLKLLGIERAKRDEELRLKR